MIMHQSPVEKGLRKVTILSDVDGSATMGLGASTW